MLLSLLLSFSACSFNSTPSVSAPAPLPPLNAVEQKSADSLTSLTIATLEKLKPAYADTIVGREGMSSLIYFSGGYTGMTEISSFPESADGVIVMRDNEPLWYSLAPDGDLLLSGDAGPTPGKLLPNGGMSLAGKNDIADPETTDFVFFVAEIDAATNPSAVILFRGWWAVHLNGPGDVHHALMTRANRSIMLFGLASGSAIQVGLLAKSADLSSAEKAGEPTFDLGETRICKVPREGYSSVSWHSCSLVR